MCPVNFRFSNQTRLFQQVVQHYTAYFEIDEEGKRLVVLAITASWQYTRYMKF
jgi:hypothetical protein